MIAAATTIFWGAFLLFVVQPLTAKRLLPWFGGSPTVWVVSLLFFQTTLLIGYTYAHVAGTYLNARRQAILHVALIALALFALPLGPHRPPAADAAGPTWAILGLLTANLALPLLTLSATNPLLQRWLAARHGGGIYRLFALSNLGSLLGLWCYPFVVEPWTSLDRQVFLWSGGYTVFAVGSTLCAMRAFRESAPPIAARTSTPDPWTRVLWLGLSATAAMLLMATSNQLTRNVAAVPFLWVLPLSLYLLSFVIAFERDRWYVRPVWAILYLATLLGVVHVLGQDEEPDFVLQLVLYSLNLLAGAVVCHGELARSKPKTERVTAFYLHVALGGALGGAAVTLVAPQLFNGYWEYPVGLLAIYVLGGLAMPLAGRDRVFWAVGGLALTVILGSYVRSEIEGATVMRRSFFGVVRVYDRYEGTENWERFLWNGPIAHGGQLMAPERRRTPILYYGPESGVGVALRHDFGRPKRVGVIGLGTGSVALYGEEGDRFIFFEINPDVVEVARRDFHYLAETPADVVVEVGDGRLLLEQSDDLELDVLVLDAFAGDAIPVHLLTREAFAIYSRHLAPDGILAVHISNLHFDLEPVVRAQADAMNAFAVLVASDADDSRMLYVTDWMLLTTNVDFLADPALQAVWTPRVADENEDLEDFLWTDDYSNLFRTLR